MSWPIVIDKGSPKHRLWQLVGYAAVAGVIFWIAFRFENYQILNFARVAADAVAILGLMIIIGYSGQVSIGQSFFFGLGAYVTAWLGVDHGWNFLLTLPVSAALGLSHRLPRRHPGSAHQGPLPRARHACARRGLSRARQAPSAREHHGRGEWQAGRRHHLEGARTGCRGRRRTRPGNSSC